MTIALSLSCLAVGAQEFNRVPMAWKWISPKEVAFTFNGSYVDDGAFAVNAQTHEVRKGIKAPFKFSSFPINPEGAVNMTYSPDSTKIAFTRANDLWVADIATGAETRLTFDGTDLILNGYSSWVYYEEILGRATRYKAFWWSPDSQKIGFYHFDNTNVPMFPIYSPKGQDGHLNLTRYPKAGEENPKVRIGMVDLGNPSKIVWADFNENEDQYFGIPFWGSDSKDFYIAREPRIQNTLDLYAVSAADGTKKHIYHEEYKTWLDWIESVVFTEKGLYMARRFETGWDQLYFLSYDGKEFRRLTSGENWSMNVVRVDEAKGNVYFIAKRDYTTKSALYCVDKKGVIKALTNPEYNVGNVKFSPDGKYFVASVSNFETPNQIWVYETESANAAWTARSVAEKAAATGKRVTPSKAARTAYMVADTKGPDFNLASCNIPQIIKMTSSDGLVFPATIVYPTNFDPSKKYPVHMDIYGGPDAPQVSERWVNPMQYKWYSDNGIIEVIADCRAGGHNGRLGLDQTYCHLSELEVRDFVEWAEYLKKLPYVNGDKIGVEGFSFGGTMTALLVLEHSDAFHYGIAGGGVYDWALYDTHYTERFMETPQTNPDGYARTPVTKHVAAYPVTTTHNDGSVMLKLTHGTGDDNVHFQNTLQLIDALHKEGKVFDFMIYPDGMHGYGGYQGQHFRAENQAFWLKYLCGKE